ncbi:hypothetical protein OAK97_02775 [bacterium]|nr:hypothetical protein [Verrucomicrobiota bacterium]MDC0268210.1 hypothetical protein [bacterium]MDG1892185.1 hypothetical protein [Verrucomicrobiota bacterium]
MNFKRFESGTQNTGPGTSTLVEWFYDTRTDEGPNAHARAIGTVI